jgi:hypothetical protein
MAYRHLEGGPSRPSGTSELWRQMLGEAHDVVENFVSGAIEEAGATGLGDDAGFREAIAYLVWEGARWMAAA